jgi:hypothetical protein
MAIFVTLSVLLIAAGGFSSAYADESPRPLEISDGNPPAGGDPDEPMGRDPGYAKAGQRAPMDGIVLMGDETYSTRVGIWQFKVVWMSLRGWYLRF